MPKTIVSIFPRQCEERYNLFHPKSHYVLPAAKPGTVATLRVDDQHESEYVGFQRSVEKLVTARVLAESLVRSWTMGRSFAGMPEGAQPGIWIADEEIPTKKQVLESPQFKQMEVAQDRYANAIIAQADKAQLGGKAHLVVSDEHRAMATYLGISGRPWQEQLKREDLVKCPFCAQMADKDAAVCPHCARVINPERYAELEAGIDRRTEAAKAKYKPKASLA